jgi:cell division protein FtsB
MKWLAIGLAALIVLIQHPLWLGKGGWLRVWDVDQQIGTQREVNRQLEARNQALDAEVRDLKQGLDAVEERARSELGMIKQDEIFFQVLEEGRTKPAPRETPHKP